MTIPQEPFDSLKERTRRVLMDNHQQMGTRSFVLPPLGPAERGPAPFAGLELGPAPFAGLELGAEAEEAAATEPTPSRPDPTPANAEPTSASADPTPAERPAPGSTDYVDLIRLRMWAIRTVRDLYPKQVCAAQRVRELSRNLGATAGDSVHYRVILDKLKEAHEEWLALEEQLWQANDAIRSTQWLVELLAEPVLHGNNE